MTIQDACGQGQYKYDPGHKGFLRRTTMSYYCRGPATKTMTLYNDHGKDEDDNNKDDDENIINVDIGYDDYNKYNDYSSVSNCDGIDKSNWRL